MPQKYDKIKEVVKEDEFMKNICCKKMGNLFAVVVFVLIVYACAETTGVYQTGDSSTETDSQRSDAKTSRTNQQEVPVKRISLYQVSLEEIAERIEYEYVYENRIYHIADYDYKQLSFLPSGEEITISVYTVEGNKLLFLPEEKANTDAVVNGGRCRLHYSEEADGFVFYVLVDWQLSENGVPVNALENGCYQRIGEYIVHDKDALVKLGEINVNFDPKATIEFQKIPVENIERTKKLARDRRVMEVKPENTVLFYNICSSPKYDYENTPLAEYIESDIAWNEEMSQKMGETFPLEIDYHLFDFNDDGVEDYLLCESGTLFNGRWGNSVEIWIQEEDGMKCVLSTLMWLHDSSADHGNLMVLDEKTNGYYAIVLPHGGDGIPEEAVLRYNERTGKYDRPADSGRGFMAEDSDFVNFRDLEKNHKILAYDICSFPKYDYENTPLAAYIEEAYVTETEETSKRTGNELTLEIDYHLFDFNDDGIEDYLLCVSGSMYCGSGGNIVEIYVQEEGGVRKVLDINARLHNGLSDHGMFTVLNEKTDGYYAIVIPESNYILRYDGGQYEFFVEEWE